jgi:hypothetical protein
MTSAHVQNALSLLGVERIGDSSRLWKNYVDRLAILQDELIDARTVSARDDAHSRLATLVASYHLLRHTDDTAAPRPVDRNARTMLRVEPDAGRLVANGGMTADESIGPGSVILGRYEVGSMLGDGGMGCVYAARDRLKDENVAIKVLRTEYLSSAAARGRFLTEARVSCRLSHPNIVRVYDVGEVNGRYFFTMERLSGQSLRQRMQSQSASGAAFPFDEAVAIAEQLLSALRHAHEHIVHRDLKPENVWLDDSGVVKLMDFGIARAFRKGHLTRTGIQLGTAYYMAPEQHSDAKDVDWRADQYAFGVIMYELLTGRVPMGAVQPIDKLRPDLPRAFARAIMRSMSPRREQRFGSLRELAAMMAGRREEDATDAIFNALVRSIALGTIAGALYAYFDSLSLGALHAWMYPAGIAVGIGTAVFIEFGESFLRSRFKAHLFATFVALIVWITAVLLVAKNLSGLSCGLIMLLCGSTWATAMDHITRRFRIAEGRYRVHVAIAGAIFGTAFGLMLLMQADLSIGRNYWYSFVSGLVPALIISVSSLRRRLWRRIEPIVGRGLLALD